jgi:3-oxoacyl-[acyl-carrier-protein] synthase II
VISQGVGLITAWSAISPFGYGRAAFNAGVLAGRAVPAHPVEHARVVPDFVIADRLGRKGTGSIDRTSALAVSAVGDLLADRTGQAGVDARTGVVLGTTSGSAHTQFEFTRESVTRRKPYFVNPALMPFALMNSAAAQCAIWHRLTGPNSTIANGRLSGLATLRYAGRLLANGRASAMVCGAAEECSAERALLERHQQDAVHATDPLGEGCAVLLVEPIAADRPGLAAIEAIDTRLALAGPAHEALAGSLRAVLATGGVEVHEVSHIATSAVDPVLRDIEHAALAAVFGPRADQATNPAALIGDTGAACGAFQVAALLSLADASPRWTVATSTDRDGTVGSALIRLFARSSTECG